MSDVDLKRRVRLVDIDGGRHLVLRLRSLGITTGSEFEVVQRRGEGVVVGSNGNRVAIGRGIVDRLIVEEIVQ